MFFVREPSPVTVEGFIAESSALPLSYEPVGIASGSPAGFSVDETSVVVGSGRAVFERARAALVRWAQFDLGWVRLMPAGAPVRPGTVVAVAVRHLGFWSLNGCRVVYMTVGDPDLQFGFAYGTLGNHAERGEEIFQVTLCPQTNAVRYCIRAVSRPRALLAWCGYPVTRVLQA